MPVPIERIQKRVAYIAAGTSTLRGQGAGVSGAAQKYLSVMDLQEFATSSATGFSEALDRHTAQLRQSFPAGTKERWGGARKALNVFLRDCLHEFYIRNAYPGLEAAWPHMEVPLDSHMGKWLSDFERNTSMGAPSTNGRLPTWGLKPTNIKYLSDDVNKRFQTFAREVAMQSFSIPRVDLDLLVWPHGIPPWPPALGAPSQNPRHP